MKNVFSSCEKKGGAWAGDPSSRLKICDVMPVLLILALTFSIFHLSYTLILKEEKSVNLHLRQGIYTIQLEDAFHDFERIAVNYVYETFEDSTETTRELQARHDGLMEIFARSSLKNEQGRLLYPDLHGSDILERAKQSAVEMYALLNGPGTVQEDVWRDRFFAQARLMHEMIEGLAETFLEDDIASVQDRFLFDNRDVIVPIILIVLTEILLVIVLVRRISAFRESDQERRKALESLQSRIAAIEAASDGIALINRDGHLIYLNEAMRRACSENNSGEILMVGEHWSRLFGEGEKTRIYHEIHPALDRRGVWHGRIEDKNGAGLPFYQDVTLTRLIDGGLICILRDITHQMEIQKIAEDRLVAMETARDGMGIVNNRGILTYMNKAMMDLHGVDYADRYRYLGHRWERLYQKEERGRITNDILPEIKEKGDWIGESAIERKDGTIVHAELSFTRLPDNGFVAMARDISERIRSQKETEQYREQLSQAQKMEAIGRLAGGVAHDFNNVLAAIMGYAEFITEDTEDDNPIHDFAKKITMASEQARDVVDQMLAFSRRNVNRREHADGIALVSDVLAMLSATLPKSIELEYEATVDRAPVYVNSSEIMQALMNLAINARDAIGEERGMILFQVDEVFATPDLYEEMLVEMRPDPGTEPPIRIYQLDENRHVMEIGNMIRSRAYVRIILEDTGSGMSREIMERVLEPFFTTKSVDKGTGLGLANVHGVVISHDGAMVVESAVGEGTRFELYFPVYESTGEGDSVYDYEKAVGSDMAAENLKSEKDTRILLVEDQEEVRVMMEAMLRRLGYSCCLCTDGLQALELLEAEREKYCLVLTDHNMPKMTGTELAENMQKRGWDIPIVIVTGYSADAMSEMVETLPDVRALLHKPVNKQKLAAALEAALG